MKFIWPPFNLYIIIYTFLYLVIINKKIKQFLKFILPAFSGLNISHINIYIFLCIVITNKNIKDFRKLFRLQKID